jgi:arginyl-tRNA synthetase
MKQELAGALQLACKELFDVETDIDLTRPDEQFGDFASNVALQLSKKLGKNPREIGEALAEKLRGNDLLADIQVAGPGFLNLRLTDAALFEQANTKPNQQSKPIQSHAYWSCLQCHPGRHDSQLA